MKNKTFISENYGQRKEHFVGQKVECTYYHEYSRGYVKAYKRSFLSRLIDKAFEPVKLGTIVGDAGVHPYWLGNGGQEQYLSIKFKEYTLPKPIPISCIQDALESAESMERLLKENQHRIGQEGYEGKYFDILSGDVKNALKFAGEL